MVGASSEAGEEETWSGRSSDEEQGIHVGAYGRENGSWSDVGDSQPGVYRESDGGRGDWRGVDVCEDGDGECDGGESMRSASERSEGAYGESGRSDMVIIDIGPS